MSNDVFLRVDGITGESQDSNHKEWIAVNSFNWGVIQPVNNSTGGGGGAGKSVYQDLSVEGLIDKATPALMGFASSGKHIPKVELSICKAGGKQIEYMRVTLEDVLITHVILNGGRSRDSVSVSYQFQGAKVNEKYWVQNNDGGRGAEISMGWDIKGNKQI